MFSTFWNRRVALRDIDPFVNRLIVFILSCISASMPLLFWPTVNATYESDYEFWIALAKTWALVQTVGTTVHVADHCLLSATQKNIDMCRKQGLSWGAIIGCCLHTWVTAEVVVIIGAFWTRGGEVHFDFTLLWHLLLVLPLSDLPFYYCHRILHRYLPDYHKLHHCCMHPTFTSNLFFHPVDLYVEFSAPVLMCILLLGTNIVGLYDPFAAFLAPVIQQIWYLMGHDSFIKNSHFIHHRYISSNYWIYNQIDHRKDSKDRMRQVLGLGPSPVGNKEE